jgi:hypothetical protein
MVPTFPLPGSVHAVKRYPPNLMFHLAPKGLPLYSFPNDLKILFLRMFTTSITVSNWNYVP